MIVDWYLIAAIVLLHALVVAEAGMKGTAKGLKLPEATATISPLLLAELQDTSALSIPSKYLPWQVRSFIYIFGDKEDRNSHISLDRDRAEDEKQALRLSRIREVSYNSFSGLRRWACSHRAKFRFLSKSFVFTSLGILVLKCFESWYKGMAEFEILLDSTDLEYQSFGSNMHAVSTSLVHILDPFDVTDRRLASMYNKLSVAMDTPCFPKTMHEYISRVGQDIAVLLSDVDAWLRLDVGQHSPQDQAFLSSILLGILILQARQADAYLRLTRLQILSAVNTCEELLQKWTHDVSQTSQTRRLPLPRVITQKISPLRIKKYNRKQEHGSLGSSRNFDHVASREQITHSTSSIGDVMPNVMYDMNPREKVIFLEGFQNELYEIAGQMQFHLENLNDLGNKQLYHSKHAVYDDKLGNWISEASSLSAKGLRVMMMRHMGGSHSQSFDTDGMVPDSTTSHEKSLNASINLLMIGRKRNLVHRSVNRDHGLLDVDNARNQSSNHVFILSAKLQDQTDDTRNETVRRVRVLEESIAGRDTPEEAVSSHGKQTNESTTYAQLEAKRHRTNETSLQKSSKQLRYFWRLGAVVVRDLSKAPVQFRECLEKSKLQQRSKLRVFKLLNVRNLLRVLIFGTSSLLGVHMAQNGKEISSSMGAVKGNMVNFFDRRIVLPISSIANDVILNKRVSLTDREALVDAKRSLNVMINDFLREYRPKLSVQERVRVASQMDMSPISEEYERELNRPIQNLLSGRIARLVLIQLQFVKKELLVSMQAIDELFNANQVNLQLLAVTPAIMSLFFVQMISKGTLNIIKTSSRGKLVESSKAVYANLRSSMRDIERLVAMSHDFKQPSQKMSKVQMGQFLSILYRIHNILVFTGSHFEGQALKQFQEDLRDLLQPSLDASQRLVLVERIIRYHPFLQNPRKFFV